MATYNIAFDGNMCVQEVETAWAKFCDINNDVRDLTGESRQVSAQRSMESHGVGFAVRRVLIMARDFLLQCPIQPGMNVRILGGLWVERGDLAVGEVLSVYAISWQEAYDNVPGMYIVQVRQPGKHYPGEHPWTDSPHLYCIKLSECEKVE